MPEPGGRPFVNEKAVPLPLAPGQASQIGLSFVYQNLALAPGLTVLENLTLGQRLQAATRAAWAPINWHGEKRRGAAVLDRYGVRLNLDRRTGKLAPVDKARLAIVRAAEDLDRYRTRSGYKHSVLVLDEPTVFLPAEEVDRLFDLIRAVEAEGAAVLFISHDLVAVRSITNRVVVLRDGTLVAEMLPARSRNTRWSTSSSARRRGRAGAPPRTKRPVAVTLGPARTAGAEDTPDPSLASTSRSSTWPAGG